MRSMQLAGKLALITGAGSGIGQAIAHSLAQRHCHLIITDINEVGLQETASQLQEYGVDVTMYRLDVASKQQIMHVFDAVASEHQTLDLLINNAGVALSGTFEDVSEADFDWLFDINFYGVVHMTRAFLPMLQNSDDARIVNLSSLFGIVAPPEQVAYAASKFAVRGFSEALRHEFAGTSIGVSVVHPGGVNTSIADNARHAATITEEQHKKEIEEFKKLLVLPASTAGEIIVTGIEKRQDRILVGNDAKLMSFIVRLFPTRYWRIIERLL